MHKLVPIKFELPDKRYSDLLKRAPLPEIGHAYFDGFRVYNLVTECENPDLITANNLNAASRLCDLILPSNTLYYLDGAKENEGLISRFFNKKYFVHAPLIEVLAFGKSLHLPEIEETTQNLPLNPIPWLNLRVYEPKGIKKWFSYNVDDEMIKHPEKCDHVTHPYLAGDLTINHDLSYTFWLKEENLMIPTCMFD